MRHDIGEDVDNEQSNTTYPGFHSSMAQHDLQLCDSTSQGEAVDQPYATCMQYELGDTLGTQ
jgi:hypothetical protein